MTVQDLIDQLATCDPDATVLGVHQPTYPLQETIAGVYVPDPEDTDDDPLVIDELAPGEQTGFVYLVLDGHPDHASPYGPSDAWSLR